MRTINLTICKKTLKFDMWNKINGCSEYKDQSQRTTHDLLGL